MEVTVEVELTASERELLLTILEDHDRELLREISRTDRHGFRLTLKEDAKCVEAILNKLRVARPAGLVSA